MIDTKLILIEGLPGCGKSMLTQYTGLCLIHNGYDVKWFNEGDIDNPINVGEIPDETFNINRYMKTQSDSWSDFSSLKKNSKTITILESSMLQHQINSLLMGNVSEEEITSHVESSIQAVLDLNPVIIYLHFKDTENCVQNACSCKGESWTKRASVVISSSAFGISRGLEGITGMIEYFSARENIETAICNKTDIPKLFIDTSSGEWDEYKKQIVSFLQLSNVLEAGVPDSELKPYTGTYFNSEKNITFEFIVQNGQLTDKISGMPMIFRDEDIFCLPGLPTELLFQKNESGDYNRFVTGGKENIYIWKDKVEFIKQK